MAGPFELLFRFYLVVTPNNCLQLLSCVFQFMPDMTDRERHLSLLPATPCLMFEGIYYNFHFVVILLHFVIIWFV